MEMLHVKLALILLLLKYVMGQLVKIIKHVRMVILLFKILVLSVKMEQQESNNVINNLVLLPYVNKDFIFHNLIVMLVLYMQVHAINLIKLFHAFLDIHYNKEIV